MNTAIKSPENKTSLPSPLSRKLRLAISCLILFHLLAVVVAPFSAIDDTEPMSPEERKELPVGQQLSHRLVMGLNWYVQPLFLRHGYRFFAPDPGPADTMRCELELADGSQVVRSYPNWKEQWPRLLYHRHFMLTSRLQGGGASPLAVDYANAYARHLAEQDDVRAVRIFYVRHDLPTRKDVLAGRKLTDPSFYVTVPDPRPVGVWKGQWSDFRLAQGSGREEGGAGVPGEEVPVRPAENAAPRVPLARPLQGAGPPLAARADYTVTLNVKFNPAEQRLDRPFFGTAVLEGLPIPRQSVELTWQLVPTTDNLELVARHGELPPILAQRIPPNEFLLRVQFAPGQEQLVLLERDEIPLGEYRRPAP